MAKFFIDRPIFAWVIAIILMLAGIASVFTSADRAVPDHRAAGRADQRNVPGRIGQDGGKHRHAGDRAADERSRPLAVPVVHPDDSGTATITLTFAAGTNPDIAQVQVQNKLQLATPLLAASRAAVRHQGHEVEQQLPAGHGVRVRRRQHEQVRPGELRRVEHSGSGQPYRRRGHGDAVRFAVRDAGLARREQADQLRLDAGGCGRPR